MGMFDSIYVYMACPYCHRYQRLEAQTKDLESVAFNYRALPADWSEVRKKFFEGSPCAPDFPLDREQTVWKDQAERIEATATISEEYQGKLNYVNVIISCSSCGKHFNGKIAIKDNKLVGEIYDITRRK